MLLLLSKRVVQAASQIGEAIEHEVRIQKFLKKTKKKNTADKETSTESEPETNEQEKLTKNQEKLRKKVTQLMKKQKVHQGMYARFYPCTAYFPLYCFAPNHSDILASSFELIPACVNIFISQPGRAIYILTCSVPIHSLINSVIFWQALDTLGNTKWRINRRVLGVVDRIWANGGCITDLVDREDVPLPEEPECKTQKMKQKFRNGSGRGTPPWEVRLTLAEDTYGKFICWRSGQFSYEEDPFQCLAACINLSEALRSSAPETTISHMSVHQSLEVFSFCGCNNVYLGFVGIIITVLEDETVCFTQLLDTAILDGSCNGLQYYAALGRDKVDRKLVKQTVMTCVYGVTHIGACERIKRRLKERCAIADETQLFIASCYAARTTLTALGEMFQAARSIMGWLGECAKVTRLLI
ncbi:hypothetical protein V6N13_099232 [Hibiscus sabdariffa]